MRNNTKLVIGETLDASCPMVVPCEQRNEPLGSIEGGISSLAE